MACQDCDENSSTLPVGPKGDPGTDGTDGADGTNFITGSGVPSVGTGVDGDSYLNLATYDLYIKSGGAWTLSGNVKGANGTGLIKFSQSVLAPVPVAGAISQTITYATLSAYGLVSTSSPGSATPPAGYEYGTEKSDFIIMVYEYLPGTTSWQKINDIRNTITVNSTGDVTIATSGFTSTPNKVRYTIIG